jgi:predicted membrane protein (TIGR00267 family)
MTKLSELARRYFVMNFFDGILTVLGVVISNFISYFSGRANDSGLILIQGLAVSLAIGISGITGGLLTEKAERIKNIIDLKRSMALRMKRNIKEYSDLHEQKFKEEDYYPFVESEQCENPVEEEKSKIEPNSDIINKDNRKTEKTINEKAENFAGLAASLINGLAPAGGGLVGLIPFLFTPMPDGFTYIAAFSLMGIILFLLGVYLARISEDRIWKYSILMVMAGVITALSSFFLTQPTN